MDSCLRRNDEGSVVGGSDNRRHYIFRLYSPPTSYNACEICLGSTTISSNIIGYSRWLTGSSRRNPFDLSCDIPERAVRFFQIVVRL